MSWPLFSRTLAWQRTRWIIVSLAIFGWGVLIPVVYAAFSRHVPRPRQLRRLPGGAA